MGIGYLYNGKELDKDLGLNWHNFGFRYYDAAIGRFTGVDPISEQFAHVSTYNYAENSPIGNIDLWGLQKLDFNGIHDPSGIQQSYIAGGKQQMRADQDAFQEGMTRGFAYSMAANGLGFLGITWALANPATTLEGVRTLGMAVAEGLTEQQIAGAALAAKVGDEVISLAPGYSNFFQRILWGQWTGKAVIPSIKNGKILLKDNAANGVADFVISEKGELILGSGHHFMSGQSKSVIAAGEMLVEDGVLKTVSNQSGHYQPSEKMLNKFLDYFKDLGVDVSKAATTTEKLQ